MKEQRLIFYVNTAEQGAEISQSEKSPDELSQTADELAQLENLKAQPGGTKAAAEARTLIDDDKTPPGAKKILKEKITAVEGAANARKTNNSKETTDTLNSATASLKKSVETQKKRKAEHATFNSEFGRFTSLTNAKELFKDVKVSMDSQTKGSVDITWDKFNSLNGFKQLGVDQKKAYLKALNDKLAGNNPEGANAIDETLRKFKTDNRLPKKWTEAGGYIDNPEKWGQTREEAAKWLMKNADNKILQANTAFKFLEGNRHSLEKAGVGMPTQSEIFEKSTDEFNKYFDGMKQKIATVDKDMAESMDAMKVSEGAEIKEIDTQNLEAMKKEADETSEKAKDITPKIVEFVKDMKLNQKTKEVAEKLKEESKTGADVEVNTVASMRERAQNNDQGGGGMNTWETMKSFFGAGSKEASEGQPEQDGKKGEKKDFDPEAIARKQVVAETLANNKNREDFEKALGVSGLEKEDLSKASGLLTIQNIDAKAIEDKLSSDAELKKLLERKAAEGAFEMKKAA